jgi:hypothetical protein
MSFYNSTERRFALQHLRRVISSITLERLPAFRLGVVRPQDAWKNSSHNATTW